MHIYLVSLKESVKRRTVLAGRFQHYFSAFKIIDAIDGRALDAKTYFSYLSKYYQRTKKLISPAEIGCTLSHKKALESFLLSAATHALIFEDDVIGSDELLVQVQLLINKIPDNSVLLLGCQDALRSTRWHYGKLLHGTKIYKVCKFSHKYVYRSCAYIVTKKSAQSILNRLNHVTLADEWGYLLKNDVDLYFTKLFHHPIDLKDSAIESERTLSYSKLWIRKFLDLKSYIRNITSLFWVLLVLILGYRKM
jgi:glycosyl transferase family 25